jgi:arylsulfatase A-like enzyme
MKLEVPARRRLPTVALACLALVAFVAGCKSRSASQFAAEAPARIVLITIDTLRADHLASYGYPRRTAPFLDELADRGARFKNAYTASSHTGPSHATLFTSLFPYQHGVLRNGEYLAPDIETLAGQLRTRGYTTGAFASVRFLQGVGSGFDTMDAKEEAEGFYRLGAETIERALSWTSKREPDERYFLWIHLYDVHQWENHRADYAQEVKRAVADSEIGPQRFPAMLAKKHGTSRSYFHGRNMRMMDRINAYDGRIRYVDELLRDLHRRLEPDGTRGESFWIVTADHGEGLGSHGHGGHGRYLYKEQLHVPLIMWFSDGRYANTEIDALVRHVDIQPTILELVDGAGQSGAPLATEEGFSLTGLLNGDSRRFPVEYSFAQRRPVDGSRRKRGWSEGEVYSLRDLRYKYIRYSGEADEFYDLAKDSLELTNLMSHAGPESDRLAAYLDAQYLSSTGASGVSKASRISPKHTEELRALGYID